MNKPKKKTLIAQFTLKEPIIKRKNSRQFLLEIYLKLFGEKWAIYKNDPDPFPSDPHAHNLDRNMKLDFRNGDLYKNNKVVDRLSKKDLIKFRSTPELSSIQLPAINI